MSACISKSIIGRREKLLRSRWLRSVVWSQKNAVKSFNWVLKKPKYIAIVYSIHLSILFIFLGQIGAMLPIWHILTIVVCVLNVLYWNSLENQWWYCISILVPTDSCYDSVMQHIFVYIRVFCLELTATKMTRLKDAEACLLIYEIKCSNIK